MDRKSQPILPRFVFGQLVRWRKAGAIFRIDSYSRSALPPYRYWYGGEIIADIKGAKASGYAVSVAEEELDPA